jgi:dienelactone hydrolase
VRYTTSLATAALALALPFILTHCAGLQPTSSPLTYDAKSVGKPNSGAALELWLPPGTGPFPAVLVLHGCSGINSSHRGWAGRLTEWGYAAVLVDSLGPRNVTNNCYGFDSNPAAILRAQDAFNAATYLRTLPTIQPDSIGLLGFSAGGTTALFAVLKSAVPTDRGGRPFGALVAYYPQCSRGKSVGGPPRMRVLGEPASDLLILIGKDDDQTPASDCQDYLKDQSGFPHAGTIKVYPGALHALDTGGLPQATREGHMIGSNAAAAEDSYVMTKAFFDARLKSK